MKRQLRHTLNVHQKPLRGTVRCALINPRSVFGLRDAYGNVKSFAQSLFKHQRYFSRTGTGHIDIGRHTLFFIGHPSIDRLSANNDRIARAELQPPQNKFVYLAQGYDLRHEELRKREGVVSEHDTKLSRRLLATPALLSFSPWQTGKLCTYASTQEIAPHLMRRHWCAHLRPEKRSRTRKLSEDSSERPQKDSVHAERKREEPTMKEDSYDLIESHGGVPIKAWTRGVPVEDGAKAQLRYTAQLPVVWPHIAVMPDVHHGFGSTVGSVIPTLKAIVPAAVGVDIGCGMVAARTTLTGHQLDDNAKALFESISKAVPHGRSNEGGDNDRGAWSQPPEAVTDAWANLEERFQRIVEKHPRLETRRQVKQLRALDPTSRSEDPTEGYVVRTTEAFRYREFRQKCAKFVRKGHVQTDKHWMRQALERNGLGV